MMAQYPPVSVIGPQFIAPKALEVIIERYGKNLVITDTNHKILLKVKPHDTTLHRQRVLLDANDQPIAMLREKNLSMHSSWNAFRGESQSDSDMLFSTSTEHVIQFKINMNVMLANKTSSKDECDLRIKGKWSKGNITIYMGNSSVAEIHKHETLKYVKDKFTVTIQPNMDYAGVVALFAIIDAMESPDEINEAFGVGFGIGSDVGNVISSS